MEINYINGDITDISSLPVFNPKQHSIILNNVNCQGSLGNAHGYILKEKFPQIEAPYFDHINSVEKYQRKSLLGSVVPVSIDSSTQVFHIFGQLFYGDDSRYLNYDSLCRALEDIVSRLQGSDSQYFDIYFTDMIGCDQAGGNPKIVETIIHETIGKLDANLYAVKYVPLSRRYIGSDNFNSDKYSAKSESDTIRQDRSQIFKTRLGFGQGSKKNNW